MLLQRTCSGCSVYSQAAISCSSICCSGVPGGKVMAGAAGAAPATAPALAGAEAAWCRLAEEPLGVGAAGGGATAPGTGEGAKDAVLARLFAEVGLPAVVFTDT